MRKKVTNDDVGEVIGKIAEKIRSDMDFEYRVAKGQMWIAEYDLVASLTDEQKILYQEYCKKREEFYQKASNIYQRKF